MSKKCIELVFWYLKYVITLPLGVVAWLSFYLYKITAFIGNRIHGINVKWSEL